MQWKRFCARAEGCVAKSSKTNLETRALKGSPTQLQITTCTSSLLHARHNKIKQIRTRHSSGCPEGVRTLRSFLDLHPPCRIPMIPTAEFVHSTPFSEQYGPRRNQMKSSVGHVVIAIPRRFVVVRLVVVHAASNTLIKSWRTSAGQSATITI